MPAMLAHLGGPSGPVALDECASGWIQSLLWFPASLPGFGGTLFRIGASAQSVPQCHTF